MRRLDALALRSVRQSMRSDPECKSFVEGSPIIREVVEAIRKRILKQYSQKMEFDFSLWRYIRLRLIQAVVVLLRQDPDVVIVMDVRRARTVEFTAEREGRHIVFHVVQRQNDEIVQQASYWDEKDLVRDTVATLVARFPRSVEVQRGPLSGTVSAHRFVRDVEELFGRMPSHRKWFNLYNELILR